MNSSLNQNNHKPDSSKKAKQNYQNLQYPTFMDNVFSDNSDSDKEKSDEKQNTSKNQKQKSINSNASKNLNSDNIQLQDWSLQTQHILMSNLVPSYLNDITQQILYEFENEISLKTQYLQQENTVKTLSIGTKNREITKLNLDLKYMCNKNTERDILYEQKWNDIQNQIKVREQEYQQIIQEKTKYWIEKINELTTLFLEVKNFILSVRNHIPREVYMGELFRYKRLFNIEELMEKSIYSKDHKVIWELYHELEVNTRSVAKEQECLKQRAESLQQQIELKDKTIQRFNVEIVGYLKRIDALEEDNKFYIQEIDLVKQECDQKVQKIDQQRLEIILKKKDQMERFHLKYLTSISQQDQIISEQGKQIQNLENFLNSMNKENLVLKRENSDLQKEIAHVNELKTRQTRIYEDSLEQTKYSKDSAINTLEKQIQSERIAYEDNKKAIEDIYEQKSSKWENLYLNLISKLRESDMGTQDKDFQLAHQQLYEQTHLDVLKQLNVFEEKNIDLTEKCNFLKEQNNHLSQQIEKLLKLNESLQYDLEKSKENLNQWLLEKEDSDNQQKSQAQQLEQQRQKLEEQDKQLKDLNDKKKKYDKELFQLKVQYDYDTSTLKQNSQRDLDKLKREMEEKYEKQINKVKNENQNIRQLQFSFPSNPNQITSQQLKISGDQQQNNCQLKQQQEIQVDKQILPEQIEGMIQNAVKTKEIAMAEEQKQYEISLKNFYDNTLKQLCEQFEKEQKVNEQKQKEFYENLLEDSKRHHAKLQESLITYNISSYDQVIQEALAKTSEFESSCLHERQKNLELSLELKKHILEITALQKKTKEQEDMQIQLKHKLEEQNLDILRQKRQYDQKFLELDYQYKVEKEKYLTVLRREKDLSKEVQYLQTQYKEEVHSQQIVSNDQITEIKQQIKQKYEDSLNKICLEQSIEVSKLSEEFQQFRDLSLKRYNALKLKYEEILLIHQTQSYSQPAQDTLRSKALSQTTNTQIQPSLYVTQTNQNGLKEKNFTSRAYTSLSQQRDEQKNKPQEFTKYNETSSEIKEMSRTLVPSHSDIAKGSKKFNILNEQVNRQNERYANVSSTNQLEKNEVNSQETIYLKKYPFTRVNQYVKNISTIDSQSEMNKTFHVNRSSSNYYKDSAQNTQYKSLTPNKANQSLDLDMLEDQQQKLEQNKKIYMNRKFNIYNSDSKGDIIEQKYQQQKNYINPSLDNINIGLKRNQIASAQQNKQGYGISHTEQINTKHNQLYSTLKHFKNNIIKVERKQIKLSRLSANNNNNNNNNNY